MFKENGKTIFDDNKPFKIEHSNIPEYEIFEEGKKFNINRDKFNYDMIIDDHKIPSFKFVMDNSLNDFYQFPNVGLLSQNPEYKYKYLHLSPAEYSKQMYQTEAGTPNELNTYMRSIEFGDPIEDIKQFDNSYQAGLDELKKIINEEAEFIKNSYESTKKQENKEAVLKIGEEFNKKKEEMFKQIPHPVKIKEAIPRLSNDKVPTEKQAKNIVRKDANKEIGTYRKEIEKILSTEKDKKVTKDMIQKINKAFKGSKSISSQPQPTTPSKPSSRAPSRAPSPQPIQQSPSKPSSRTPSRTPSRAPSPQPQPQPTTPSKTTPSKAHRFETNTPQKAIITQKETTPPPVKPLSKVISQPQTTPTKPAASNEKKSSDSDDEKGYDSESTTVVGDAITVSDTVKPFYEKAQKILNSKTLKDLKNSANLKNVHPDAYVKLNEIYSKITNKPQDIKKIGTLRKHLLVNFKT